MAILLRRLIVSMLIPYLWRRWRRRSSSQREARPPIAGHGQPQPQAGAAALTTGLVSSQEHRAWVDPVGRATCYPR